MAKAVLGTVSCLVNLGRHEQSEKLLEVAGSIIEAEPDLWDLQIRYGLERGQIRIRNGQFQEARNLFREALAISRKSANLGAELVIIQNIAQSYIDEGTSGMGLRWARRGIKRAQVLGHTPDLLRLNQSAGSALLQLGRHQESLSFLLDARDLARDFDLRSVEGRSECRLGEAFLAMGDTPSAVRHFEAAARLGISLSHSSLLANAFFGLATSWLELGDLERAQYSLRSLLNIPDQQYAAPYIHAISLRLAYAVMETDPLDGVTRASSILSMSIHASGEPSNERGWLAFQAAETLARFSSNNLALEFYERSLQAYQATQNIQMQFHVRNNLGNALTALGRFEEAHSHFTQCLSLSDEMNDRAMRLLVLGNMGEMLQRSDRELEAIDVLSEALEISESLRDQDAKVQVLTSLGIAYLKSDEVDQAERVYKSLLNLDLAPETSPMSVQAHAHGGIAGVAFARGQYTQAATDYQNASKLHERIGDERHYLEDLAGFLISLAAAGNARRFNRNLPMLVREGIAARSYFDASGAFARCGHWWLQNHSLARAAECYALAISIPGGQPAASPEVALDAIAAAARHLKMNLEQFPVVLRDRFSILLSQSLAELVESEVRDFLEPIINTALGTTAEIDSGEERG